MKTLMKLIMSAVIALGIMTLSSSCKKEIRENPEGYMTVKMTDAPADYLAVKVDITGFNVHTESKGWINVPIKAGIYNLLELQNDITVVLADRFTMPIGRVSQVRFVLGSHNTIVTTTGEYDLKVPSGMESGLKINVDETIENNEHIAITLDFDAKASVVENGVGDFILKPVIKVKSIVQL